MTAAMPEPPTFVPAAASGGGDGELSRIKAASMPGGALPPLPLPLPESFKRIDVECVAGGLLLPPPPYESLSMAATDGGEAEGEVTSERGKVNCCAWLCDAGCAGCGCAVCAPAPSMELSWRLTAATASE
jgi:hypothetical protein